MEKVKQQKSDLSKSFLSKKALTKKEMGMLLGGRKNLGDFGNNGDGKDGDKM